MTALIPLLTHHNQSNMYADSATNRDEMTVLAPPQAASLEEEAITSFVITALQEQGHLEAAFDIAQAFGNRQLQNEAALPYLISLEEQGQEERFIEVFHRVPTIFSVAGATDVDADPLERPANSLHIRMVCIGLCSMAILGVLLFVIIKNNSSSD